MQINDIGKRVSEKTVDGVVKKMTILETELLFYLGLVVEDERCVQRYANIEVSGTSNTFDEDILIGCLDKLPDQGENPGTIILASRSIMTQMKIRAKDKNNVQWMPDKVWGDRMIPHFQGVPVYLADKLLETETVVS
jgi:hypothetical protein